MIELEWRNRGCIRVSISGGMDVVLSNVRIWYHDVVIHLLAEIWEMIVWLGDRVAVIPSR